MLRFDTFVEACSGVCFARCLADRCDAVECLAGNIVACRFMVSGRQAEVAKPKIDRQIANQW